MNAKMWVLYILLGTGASLANQQPAQTPTDVNPARGSISGRLTIDGQGASDVVVLLSISSQTSDSNMVGSTKTDAEGRFKLSDLEPGRYAVTVFAPAHIRGSKQTSMVALSEGQHLEGIEIDLVLGGVITGRLLDQDGQPVVGQQVDVVNADDDKADLLSSRRAVFSDDRGVYRIYGLPAARYLVHAGTDVENSSGMGIRKVQPLTFHPNAPDRNKAAIVRVGSGGEVTGIDIAFGKPRSLFAASGRVVEAETGRPVEAKRIGWERIRQNGSSSSYLGPTDAKGFFKLPELGPGRFSVWAEDEGGSTYSDRAEFEIKDGDVSGLTVKVHKGAAISGVLHVESGMSRDELSKIRMWVVGTDRSGRSGGLSRLASISLDGIFEVNGLRAGETRIRFMGAEGPSGFVISEIDHPLMRMAEGDGYGPEGAILLQKGDQISGVRILLRRLKGGIRGAIKVVGGDIPLDSFLRLTVWNPSGNGTRVVLDPNRRFEVKGLPPGEYRMTAEVESGSIQSGQSRSRMSAEKTLSISDRIEEIELEIVVSKPEKK